MAKIAVLYLPIRVYHGAYRVGKGIFASFDGVPPGQLVSVFSGVSFGFKEDLRHSNGFLPAPHTDTFNLFSGSGGLVVYAGKNLSKDPDSAISGPTPSYAGPSLVSFTTGWMNSNTNGYLPEHRVAQYQTKFGSILERGNIAPNSTVNGSFLFDRAVFGDESVGGGSATWASGVLNDLIDQVELAAAKLGGLVIKATDAEPVIETRPSTPNVYTMATCTGGIKIVPEKDGGIYADGHLRVLVVESGGQAKLYTAVPAGLGAAVDNAKAAADEYSQTMAKALAVKASGGTPQWPPLVRPEPTTTDDLPDSIRKLYDEWWERTSAIVRRASAAAGPTEATAYADYLAAGGPLGLQEWKSARDTAVDSNSWTGGLWDYLKAALGYVGGKGEDMLKWAGDSTVEIAKDWGPAGVVGAYGGVKAVDALGDDSGFMKVLPWLLGGLAALFILK